MGSTTSFGWEGGDHSLILSVGTRAETRAAEVSSNIGCWEEISGLELKI